MKKIKKEIIAIIPARSGSKGIPDKNIKILKGKPLIAYSILQAKASKYIKRAIVSTDSEEYRKIALEYGAEAPFIRPKGLARDSSPDLEVFRHVLDWLKENENYLPDIVVHLRPTYPLRKVSDIDRAIEKFVSFKRADSLRSVAPAKQTPYKMWRLKEDESLEPLMEGSKEGELYNSPRQMLPQILWQNAAIDIIKTKTILEKNSMSGNLILSFVMEDYGIDLDDIDDWKRTEDLIKEKGYL